jgi:hypothetical protein
MGMIKKITHVVNWFDRLFTKKAVKASLLANYMSWYNEDNNWLRTIQANGRIYRMLSH